MTYSNTAQAHIIKCYSFLNRSIATMLAVSVFLSFGPDICYADSSQTINNTHASNYENKLITSLRDIQEQRIDGALEKIESLVHDNPKFKLAQLIYGDLLLAKAGPITDFGNPSSPSNELLGLRNEAQARWQHHTSHQDNGAIPSYLLQLADDIKHAIVIDLSKSRLYLYKNINGKLELTTDYYVSIGKNGAEKQFEGDKKTPIGVYHITDFLPPKQLPDFYGAGAFPINYPNALDKQAGKTGYGIWLHGTPTDTYSRRPRASDGCVTLSNNDLEAIKPLLQTGQTPVIIAETIEWSQAEDAHTQRQRIETAMSAWREDWQSMNVDHYLSHYSLDFRNEKMDYAAWTLHKQRINKNKSFVEVKIDTVNIFAYPGKQNLRIVTFDQSYNSNNYHQTLRKQQYWQKEDDGIWRIIYEGPA